jgi:long-chain acyl-CoA synthetase
LEFVWNLVLGIYLEFGAWNLVLGICLEFGAWNLVLGICLEFGAWCLGFNLSYLCTCLSLCFSLMINTNYPDKPALITKDQMVTYRELFKKIQNYARIFSAKGYEKIAIFSENRPEWIYSFFAAWQNDAIVVPVDFLSSAEDAAYILNDCRPELVFASRGVSKTWDKLKGKLEYSPDIIYFEDITTDDKPQEIFWKNPGEIDKTAVIIYTSGTTGSPKGVMLSFKNLAANIKAVTEDVKIFNAERPVLMLLPLHHIFPLAGSMLAPLSCGGCIVMSPSMQSSDILETLKNNQVKIMIGVPRLYELLYKGIRAKIEARAIGRIFYRVVKLSNSRWLAKKIFKKVHEGLGGHLEIMIAGGAALNKEAGKFFETLGFEVLEGYGMTEAAPMITFPRPGHAIIGTTGQALPGLTVEIRDGEIVAKGPNIMKGYYNRPEETAEVLKDGWLYTGDLGEIDDHGYLRITGRKKEIIILPNGKNVNPVELETKLEKNVPGIKEAGVLLYHDNLYAIIFPDYQMLSGEGVKDPEKYFRDNIFPDFNRELTSYKRIMKFSLVKEELPRTRLGKIQRYKLEELIANKVKKVEKPYAEAGSEEYLAVKSFLESQVDMTVSPDDHLEFDIALDSLGKLSLIDFIEKTFGVKIEEENLPKFPSVKSLVDHIRINKRWHHEDVTNWAAALKEKVHVKLPKTWPTLAVIKNSARGFFSIYSRLKIEGRHNLPEGPCIIAPNHQSFFDGLYIVATLKMKTLKNSYFYAKKKHVNNWFLRFFANTNNVIVMDVNKDLKESIQKLAEVLKKGKNVVIFPEGTRTKTGNMGEFKKTFAILSKELNIPVVPVAIDGAYHAMHGKAIFPIPFRQIRVSFAPPVYPLNYSSDELTSLVQERINNMISA